MAKRLLFLSRWMPGRVRKEMRTNGIGTEDMSTAR
jgi:hypothetical protein